MKTFLSRIVVFSVLAIFLTVSIASADVLKEIKIKTSASNSLAKDKIESITILLKGVEESELNLGDKILTVKYNPELMSPEMLVYTINNLGYNAEVVDNEKSKDGDKNAKN